MKHWFSFSKKKNLESTNESSQVSSILESDDWLQETYTKLGMQYDLHVSENFIIVTSEDRTTSKHFLSFLESALRIILRELNGIASDGGKEKNVVLMLEDQQSYYDYIAAFYPAEGEFGLSSGVFINKGYKHFALPAHEINHNEPVIAHELTHACLAHLDIPLWLNEGLAVSMESIVCSDRQFYIDKVLINKHQAYWNSKNIQAFWKGDSFSFTDEGQELSYHLAELLVRNISGDYEQFVQFVLQATAHDSGEASANKHLGISLADLITGLLGEGDWQPK